MSLNHNILISLNDGGQSFMASSIIKNNNNLQKKGGFACSPSATAFVH